MSLLPVSMVSIFLVPFAIPLCCLGLMLVLTRRRSNVKRTPNATISRPRQSSDTAESAERPV